MAPSARNKLIRGDRVELTIDSLAQGGAGVGRADGFVVFARGGFPGDRVIAEVTGGKKRFAEARVVEVIDSGPDRVPERAPHPGAAWQSLRYDAQLAEKARQVTESLERLGGFEGFEIEPIIAAGSGHDDPAIWNYRNKLEYSFGIRDDGSLALGFHAPGRWDVIEDVDDVVLASEPANEIRRLVRDWAQEQGLSPYDRNEQFGFLRLLIIREGRTTDQRMVRLVTTNGELDTDGLVEALGDLATSVVWSRSDNPGNALQGTKDRVLTGKKYIEEQILDLRYRISTDAFFQTNTAQTERLYETAIDYAGLTGRDLVYDLYCGSGTIGIAMAENAGAVWGIEIVQSAVEDAAGNANLNGITNAEFVAGDMRLALPALIEHAGAPDVVVLDPPRAGLSAKVVRRVIEAGPKRIVYVSCNPTTLAPNARQLCDAGYELKRVRPVDMFPHTPHIECVAQIDLVDDDRRLAAIEERVEERRAKSKK
jgi:23S rRNA (uracil1939-C5)-methyltransferase